MKIRGRTFGSAVTRSARRAGSGLWGIRTGQPGCARPGPWFPQVCRVPHLLAEAAVAEPMGGLAGWAIDLMGSLGALFWTTLGSVLGAIIVYYLGLLLGRDCSLISLPAGVERMPFWRFLALTTLGSAIWSTTTRRSFRRS